MSQTSKSKSKRIDTKQNFVHEMRVEKKLITLTYTIFALHNAYERDQINNERQKKQFKKKLHHIQREPKHSQTKVDRHIS